MGLLNRQITFGGVAIPAMIASSPHIIRPKRKMTVTQIAGSNREIVDMEDAWECYEQPYTLFVGDGSEDSIQTALDNVAKALFKKGWQILLDDFEPDIYRLAYYEGGFDVENRKTRLGKFDITFKCRPERFLASGNTPVVVASGGKVTNPTTFDAKPIIHITGVGSGTVTVAGVTMSFTDMVDYLNVDCDRMDVYRDITENRNNLMTGGFPVLHAGDNTVTYTGGVTSVTIDPRFFRI